MTYRMFFLSQVVFILKAVFRGCTVVNLCSYYRQRSKLTFRHNLTLNIWLITRLFYASTEMLDITVGIYSYQ